MTLPRGFNTSSDKCPVCDKKISWSYKENDFICKNGECKIGRKAPVYNDNIVKKFVRLLKQ